MANYSYRSKERPPSDTLAVTRKNSARIDGGSRFWGFHSLVRSQYGRIDMDHQGEIHVSLLAVVQRYIGSNYLHSKKRNNTQLFASGSWADFSNI